MIKAIIFDLFGVIRPETVGAAYRQLGGDADKDREFIRRTMRAANLGQIPSSRTVFADRLGISTEQWMRALMSFENDRQLLGYIEKLHNHYKTGLLSNISRDGLPALFEPGQLEELFNVTIGSGDVGIAKPDPRIYWMVADALGVAPTECVFIDDKPGYCAAARQLGMQAIVYTSFAQLKTALTEILRT